MDNNIPQNISVFDLFKIGIGPSSSHTIGPWKAALQFLDELNKNNSITNVESIHIELYGSLALTGKGHGTDNALMLGLSGYQPDTIPTELVSPILQEIKENSRIDLCGQKTITFIPGNDIIFKGGITLDYHPNGLKIAAHDKDGHCLLSSTYFSIGGGFVIREGEELTNNSPHFPFSVESAKDLKLHCEKTGHGIEHIVYQNELTLRGKEELDSKILHIWDVMSDAIFKGCHTDGMLPGSLKVSRRAADLHRKLIGSASYGKSKSIWMESLKSIEPSFDKVLKFISCFAIATNEENANFGRVVTAPTNGAAGVLPAVLMYFICFNRKKTVTNRDIIDFICVASEVGGLFKKRATISAAMGGCQAEIGVSSAMAAAALTSGLGGSVDQSLMAAEIAMEHHLGLTCDPVQGLVQVPCIERNSMGAIKAITAAELALDSNPQLSKISLDDVIKTMWNTACDMDVKYKETSLGGLAVNISVSLPEC